jgi:hypothetical protein
MKKIIAALIAIVCLPCSAFAVDFEVSGEVKTGFYTEQIDDKSGVKSQSRIHNNDGDSGSNEGRVRLNLNIGYENIGMRTRYTQQQWKTIDDFMIEFIYGYGYFLDEQLKFSAGLLGESPWGAGGPDLFEYVDDQMGIRTEWTPNFLKGLNLGFVLNRFNATGQVPVSVRKQTFYDMLADTVLGISYEHDYFAFRFSYRFDSEADWAFNGDEGSKLVYRAEERLLGKLLPGMQIFANGYFYGINASSTEKSGSQNWLYIYYSPDNFTANLNIRYSRTEKSDVEENGQTFLFKPGFVYKFFGNFLNVGIGFGLEIGMENEKRYKDTFYNYWYIEPYVRVNINSNSYAAVYYNFTSGGDDSKTNWLNIRMGYTF